MKDAGVDFISTCIDQTSVVTLKQEMARQGMEAVVALLAAGPQFDQASVIEAFNQVTDYTAGGLLAPPVDWTTAHDAGGPDDPRRVCAAYLVVKGGTLELQGDPAEPFFCWQMPLDEWQEPETLG